MTNCSDQVLKTATVAGERQSRRRERPPRACRSTAFGANLPSRTYLHLFKQKLTFQCLHLFIHFHLQLLKVSRDSSNRTANNFRFDLGAWHFLFFLVDFFGSFGLRKAIQAKSILKMARRELAVWRLVWRPRGGAVWQASSGVAKASWRPRGTRVAAIACRQSLHTWSYKLLDQSFLLQNIFSR